MRFSAVSLLLTGVLLFPAAGFSQSAEATISGFITDTSGAAVVGASVSATNLATSRREQGSSDEKGFYTIRALPIGTYLVSVEKEGFRKYVRENLVLTTGQQLTLGVRLEVGAVTESILVTSQASLLETRTSEQAQLVEARNIADMPLGDRRTMNIIQLTGAAVFINYDSGGKPNFSLAGGRTQSQNFYMDGGTIQNMRLGIGQIDTDPPVETVAEVKVLSNGFSAEYGGSAGGVVVATTKSGTNQLRGSAYEYLRNEKLDAGNFFAPFVDGAKVRAPLRYNIFGTTAGGPVRIPKLYNGRDKSFWFFSYEGSRRSQGNTGQFTVPDEAQRGGDFSRTFAANGSVIPIFDPLSTRVEAGRSVRTPFAGNLIPSNRLDPVARAILPFYPLPNRPPDNISGVNNFRTNFQEILTRDAFLVKGDHAITAKDRISLRYLYNSDNVDFTTTVTDIAADTNSQALRHQNFYYATYTRVFTPTIINEFRFNYGNRINHQRSYGLDGGWPSKLGLKGVPNDAFPTINVAGIRGLGAGNHERRQFPIQQFMFSNNISVILNRHALKAGFELRPSYNFEINRPQVSGNFNFNPLATGQPGVAASGFGVASLLVGAPQGVSVRTTEALDRRSYYAAWFVQDDWTVTRNLTLNYGLRWETDTPIRDIGNRMNGFDQSAINPVSGTPGVVRFMGLNGFRTKPYDTDWNNFGPRFGFAYKPGEKSKMVIRGGFGLFFAHPFDGGAPNSASLGFEQSANVQSPDNGVTIPFYLKDGVPGLAPTLPALNDSFGAVRLGQNPNTAVAFYEENRRTGYSIQYNLSIQRELRGNILLEGSYLANLSRKLSSTAMGINQVPPDQLTPTSTQRDRPFPQFTNVTLQFPSLGVSSYHALLVRAEKRFENGWNFLGTYTFSKFLNNTNEGGSTLGADGGPYSNLYNRRADWGPSENDVRHRFTWSSVYELPFGAGKRYLAKSPARFLLGGWGVGGIFTLQSGAPFTVTTQVNTVFSAIGALRADVSRNPNLTNGERSLARWFDTSAFTQPAAARFGNQGVNILRADGIFNLNASLQRNFGLWSEQSKLQFRAEFFNLTNTANFGIPGRILGAPGFGVVGSAGPARSIQLGLRLGF
jgi:hypothetical protein